MTSEISAHPALSRTMQGGDMLQADEVVAMLRLHELDVWLRALDRNWLPYVALWVGAGSSFLDPDVRYIEVARFSRTPRQRVSTAYLKAPSGGQAPAQPRVRTV